jgi:hypothetical protein
MAVVVCGIDGGDSKQTGADGGTVRRILVLDV